MADENKNDTDHSQTMTDLLKSWVMVVLTLIFLLLYISALFGLIAPLKDVSIIHRLEPIIFVIIGYYFGRLPSQATENTLKNEITRQSQKAAAAQQIKENIQQEREALEEKIRNARIALAPRINNSIPDKSRSAVVSLERQETTDQSVEIAIKILDL